MNASNRFAVIGLLSSLAALSSIAQENHYWTEQYGTRAGLLGGQVISGIDDSSATFYNPGALGFATHNRLALSANAYYYEEYSYRNATADHGHMNSSGFDTFPTLVAGIRRPWQDRPHVFGYSLLTRYRSEYKLHARRDSEIDILGGPYAGHLEDYIGQFALNSELLEIWGGVSWGYRISEHVGIGASAFLAYRQQEIDSSSLRRAVTYDNYIAIADELFGIDYDNFRMLGKIGLAAQFPRWRFGLTLTTPSVNLSGDGTVYGDITYVNFDYNGDGTDDAFLADDRQDGLDSDYRSPLSCGAGFTWTPHPRIILHASTEWFAHQSRYTIIQPNDSYFIRPAGVFPEKDSQRYLRVTKADESVLNYGLGVEVRCTDQLSLLTAFRTDFSSANLNDDDADGLSLDLTPWDIYHVSFGFVYTRKKSSVGVGIVMSYGDRDHLMQIANFKDPSESDLLSGPTTQNCSASYRAVRFILGYNTVF